MSHLEQFKNLLKDAHVGYEMEAIEEGFAIKIFDEVYKDGRVVHEGFINRGYWGFHNRIEFDNSGKMIQWGIWE